MYKITVPVMNENLKRNGRERTLAELRRFDAERVVLACDTYELDEKKQAEVFAELADNAAFFKSHGFEVAAWIWTFWIKNPDLFRHMRMINGDEVGILMCPTDEKFVAFAENYVKNIAKCGVDIIQFDDDFRYGFLGPAPACLCDGHLERINRITGESSTREEIAKHVTSGGKNKYRDAFLQANGEVFREFAAAIRRAVDEINPEIRISLCTCISSWDLDGTDARELATVLAGNTKPILRLIGAPYWASDRFEGCMLQDTIEHERMESAWTRTDGIEIMAEGDAYPRPRTACPASYVEGFDTAIRAAGCTDGILKYGIDYHSNADYETGYAVFHERNRKLYTDIERIFSNKTHVGVRVYESMKKISDAVMTTKVNKTPQNDQMFFSKASRTLAYNTIPTVYEGSGISGIAFDENARNLPPEALQNGLIIDIAAAEILTERGVDVGLTEIGESTTGTVEHFIRDNNHTITGGATVYDIKISESAEILSDIVTSLGTLPMSYRYENADGNRFLVLNVNTRSSADAAMKQYARSKQYAEEIEWLSGKKLPAYTYGHPAMYIQCKKSDGAMAVGLWNFFADVAINPIVELDEKYSEIEFINVGGHIDGSRVVLDDVAAFGFVGFEVRK